MAHQHTHPSQPTEPCILLFGSLSLTFDDAAFAEVRKAIVENDENAWLFGVVSRLSQDLETILSKLPSLQLSGLQARKELADLQEALIHGRPLHLAFPLHNAILIPLVVIDQLCQYAGFVRQKSSCRNGVSKSWPTHSSGTEILGLCTGILSSFAASSARSWDDFRKYGAAAIRVGLLIGLAIDSQDAASGGGRWRSLSVAWSGERGDEQLKRVLQDFDEVASISFTVAVCNIRHQINLTPCPGLRVSLLRQMPEHSHHIAGFSAEFGLKAQSRWVRSNRNWTLWSLPRSSAKCQHPRRT
jgi:hypothetical protein